MLIAARKLSWADDKAGCFVLLDLGRQAEPGRPPGSSAAMNSG